MNNNVALVAINLYYNDSNNQILLNKTAVPIIFYWNKNNDENIIESILNDSNFCNLIKNKIITPKIYSNSSLSYIYYKLNNQFESFSEETFNIQDFIKIDFFDNLVNDILNELSKIIYFKVFNAEYIERNDDPIVYDVYMKSSLINKQQLTITTFLNYMKTLAEKTYGLSKENLDILYRTAAEIIDKTKKYHEYVG